MNSDVCLLITIWNHEFLTRHAIKLSSDALAGDVLCYPMEPENKKKIAACLPDHIRTAGIIVQVDQISSVTDIKGDSL